MQSEIRLISLITEKSKRSLELPWKSMVNTLVLLTLVSVGPVFTRAQISNFQHVVIIFQENRTPDNLFQACVERTVACARVLTICGSTGIDNLGNTRFH